MLYDFTEILLDKEEFDNLVFMNPPPWWEEHYFPNYPLTEEQTFLSQSMPSSSQRGRRKGKKESRL